MPNISPKEIYTHFEDKYTIITSPKTVKDIKVNNNVCVSFIDVLIQQGFQVKGYASIIDENDEGFSSMNIELLKIAEGKFPFSTITKIKVESVKSIIAPKYILYPNTTEKEQTENARKMYGV